MFIISLKYTTTISEIEAFLPKHAEFLEKNYNSGNLLMSDVKIHEQAEWCSQRLKQGKKFWK